MNRTNSVWAPPRSPLWGAARVRGRRRMLLAILLSWIGSIACHEGEPVTGAVDSAGVAVPGARPVTRARQRRVTTHPERTLTPPPSWS